MGSLTLVDCIVGKAVARSTEPAARYDEALAVPRRRISAGKLALRASCACRDSFEACSFDVPSKSHHGSESVLLPAEDTDDAIGVEAKTDGTGDTGTTGLCI